MQLPEKGGHLADICSAGDELTFALASTKGLHVVSLTKETGALTF